MLRHLDTVLDTVYSGPTRFQSKGQGVPAVTVVRRGSAYHAAMSRLEHESETNHSVRSPYVFG